MQLCVHLRDSPNTKNATLCALNTTKNTTLRVFESFFLNRTFLSLNFNIFVFIAENVQQNFPIPES